MASPSLDPYEFLGITLNSDGSVTRYKQPPTTSAAPKLISDSQLTLSKDIPLNPTNLTFIRLYRPVSPRTEKLPIIVFFHGGGFILNSVSTTPIHVTCIQISAQSSALVMSVEYRLPPEQRLPAAYEDGVDAIRWLRDQALTNDRDEWLAKNADFSKVYLMGTSAGGNIAYFTCLRSLDLVLYPIKIAGLILDQPFFGGVDRTESEIRLANDEVLPLAVTDVLWYLALPLGADRDDKYSNPFGERHRFLDEKIRRLPKSLIRARGEDQLVDRQKKLAKLLESLGVEVIRRFYEEGKHVVELTDPTGPIAQTLYDDVKTFINSN